VLDWLKLKNHSYSTVRLFEGESLPSLSETDWLIILGGPMNVDEVDQHPWLGEEKEFLRHAIAEGKTCLGLCLGGQLLAQALGATVRKNESWEAGWHTVQIGSNQIGSDFRLTVFQWHQDTFALPEGATRVATNRNCENQAFAYGDHVVGLQFHPEATEDWVRECLEDKEQPSGPHAQKPEQMLENIIFIHPMRKWFFELLDRMESVTRTRFTRPRART